MKVSPRQAWSKDTGPWSTGRPRFPGLPVATFGCFASSSRSVPSTPLLFPLQRREQKLITQHALPLGHRHPESSREWLRSWDFVPSTDSQRRQHPEKCFQPLLGITGILAFHLPHHRVISETIQCCVCLQSKCCLLAQWLYGHMVFSQQVPRRMLYSRDTKDWNVLQSIAVNQQRPNQQTLWPVSTPGWSETGWGTILCLLLRLKAMGVKVWFCPRCVHLFVKALTLASIIVFNLNTLKSPNEKKQKNNDHP